MSILSALSGAAGASGGAVYVEDVFSTYLYTGNGGTQTITNGIDLTGKGGLVWTKYRASASSTTNNILVDTQRGSDSVLVTNRTDAAFSFTNATVFSSSGFSMGVGGSSLNNENNATYASWTFRKQAKFFDVVTYTGNGTNNRQISHGLNVNPGFIVVKATSTTSDWAVIYAQGGSLWTGATYTGGYLNSSAAFGQTTADGLGCSAVSSSSFTINNSAAPAIIFNPNQNGVTYVAYLFASSNSEGFGPAGTDSVVACGSYTADGSGNATVNLGWEPQFVLIKNRSNSGNWVIADTMRGMPNGGSGFNWLRADITNAEVNYTTSPYVQVNATGFQCVSLGGVTNTNYNNPGDNYIYLAIRRGPMRTPTDATKVFAMSTWTGSSDDKDMGSQTSGFGTGYLSIPTKRDGGQTSGWFDSLRGVFFLTTHNTAAEFGDGSGTAGFKVENNRMFLKIGSYFGGGGDGNGSPYVGWHFRRAPGFFDVVCYTGTGGGTVSHNLGTKPQLMLVKRRDTAGTEWRVYAEPIGATQYAKLHLTDAFSANSTWLNTEPTATVFSVSANGAVGASGATYVAYLFATCAGVSKVGSYTGNGSSQTIDCGFASGARFVLIKRTDAAGDWYVWDVARGIVSGNDPRLSLNTTAAEVTTDDSIDPASSGFIVNQLSATNINVNAATYIFLAIA